MKSFLKFWIPVFLLVALVQILVTIPFLEFGADMNSFVVQLWLNIARFAVGLFTILCYSLVFRKYLP